MPRAPLIHSAEQHRSAIAGVEAISVVSSRHFPRHAHDQFGIGVMDFGAHRTWSPLGTVEAVAGDVVTINPGEIHDGVAIAGRVRGWRMLFFDPQVVTAEFEEEPAGIVEIAQPVLRDRALKTSFDRLFARLTTAQPDRLELEEALLCTLARAIGRYGVRSAGRAQPRPAAIAKALQRLDDAPEVAVTLSELAALSGLSRFQLLRGFVQTLGITPHAYLLQRRVRATRRLLAAGRTPAEAAAEAGFSDQSHMTRVFARQLGITPARYRSAVV